MPAGVKGVDREAFIGSFRKSVKNKIPDGLYSGEGKEAAQQWLDIELCLNMQCRDKHEAFAEIIADPDPLGGVHERANQIIFACLYQICTGSAAKLFRNFIGDEDGRRIFKMLKSKHNVCDRVSRKVLEK